MALPRRGGTARLRFTALYGGLFLLSGVALLGLTSVLTLSNVVTVPAPPVSGPGERVAQLEAELAQVRADQGHRLLTGSVLALAVMVVVSLVLGRLVAGRVLRPLAQIAATTRRISADNLHERLAVDGPRDEVKELADTVDALLERLERSFAAQRRFVADASHELRTPLATMRASVDVATAKPDPVAASTLALGARVRTELDHVDRLLDGLLVLARAQHGDLPDRVPVSLGDTVGQALAGADLAARNLTLDADGVEDSVLVLGSPTLLARLAENLLDNAVTHNEDGGWIRVAVRAVDGTAHLTVETGGALLDPAQVAQLTEPFRRLGADRTRSADGSGLGLSIVEAITVAHGGHLELAARPEGGLRVTTVFPGVAS